MSTCAAQEVYSHGTSIAAYVDASPPCRCLLARLQYSPHHVHAGAAYVERRYDFTSRALLSVLPDRNVNVPHANRSWLFFTECWCTTDVDSRNTSVAGQHHTHLCVCTSPDHPWSSYMSVLGLALNTS